MRSRVYPFAVILAACVVGGCSEPTRPAASPEAVAPTIVASSAEMGQMQTMLADVRGRLLATLKRENEAARIDAVFTRLAERLEAGDAAGIASAVASARKTLTKYTQSSGDDASSAADIDAMNLMLDEAETFLDKHATQTSAEPAN